MLNDNELGDRAPASKPDAFKSLPATTTTMPNMTDAPIHIAFDVVITMLYECWRISKHAAQTMREKSANLCVRKATSSASKKYAIVVKCTRETLPFDAQMRRLSTHAVGCAGTYLKRYPSHPRLDPRIVGMRGPLFIGMGPRSPWACRALTIFSPHLQFAWCPSKGIARTYCTSFIFIYISFFISWALGFLIS